MEICKSCVGAFEQALSGLKGVERGRIVRILAESASHENGGCNAMCWPIVIEMARGNTEVAASAYIALQDPPFNPYRLPTD